MLWWSQWKRLGSNEVHFNNYICTQTTWPYPFPRGLPSLDYLFGYGKRIVYRTLVQNVYSSERSFTKNNHNNTDISVEQEIKLEKRCEITAQNSLFFCPALILWLGICTYFHKLLQWTAKPDQDIFPQLSSIFPTRNVSKHRHKHIFLVQQS